MVLSLSTCSVALASTAPLSFLRCCPSIPCAPRRQPHISLSRHRETPGGGPVVVPPRLPGWTSHFRRGPGQEACPSRALAMGLAGDEVRASAMWESRWSQGLKKGDMWDTGAVSPALEQLLDSGALPQGRALVPGCGRGYDAIAFGKRGYDAVGLDLAPTGIEEAKQLLEEEDGPISGKVEFRAADFFNFTGEENGKFDVIFDYTFLCALDPSAREDWADHMVSLLEQDNGELITLIFPIVDKKDGPPFAVSEAIVSNLLEPRGLRAERLEKVPPEMCHPGREGKTAIGRWRFSPPA